MLLAPGLVPGIPAYSIKVHAKFPGQDPAIRGVLVLHDLATGAVLALIESSHLTALRTGLAGALGADALARRDARTVAIIGAGVIGATTAYALVVTRNTAFDTKTNASLGASQDITGSDGVLGAVAATASDWYRFTAVGIQNNVTITTATWSIRACCAASLRGGSGGW